jgi:ABC-type multidrug transport system ATPase subunit/surface polysaccharide O-acyltransferase-like enzyme
MTTQDRFHALDAARAFALLLGIVLHATMSFFLVLPAQDVSQSTTLGVSFYVIHMFRMSLFYFIAGFFAHLLFHRRGARAFIKDRAKRILVPMTGGWIVLAPPTIAAVIWGLTRTFPDGPPPGAEANGGLPQGFPLTHLWFLYYLSIFYVLALALRAAFVTLVDRSGALRALIDKVVGASITSYLAPLVLAAPIFAVLYTTAEWPVWFGVPTPDTGFTPKIPALVGFGTAFAFGWVLHRQAVVLGVLEKQWLVNLTLAVGLTTACLALIGLAPSLDAPTVVEGGARMRAVYAACYTAAIWCWIFGLVGAAMRFCSQPSELRRYLADSSYWLYLGHLPIVFFLQAALMKVPLHWAIKFPLIVAITLAVLLVSYHYLVRPTWIGALLNGRKYPRRKHAPAPAPTAPAPNGPGQRRLDTQGSESSFDTGRAPEGTGPTAVALLANVTKRYGKTVALDGVTIAVRPGELLALLGPNGAGKTTAIGLWLGLLEPNEGEVTLMGGSPIDVQSRLDVGVMMQEIALSPELRARELIAQTASYYRNPLSVEETLALTGTAALADKRYGKLSAGQKRQVQFATTICGRPKLLFLDEPTVGLDITARETMWRTIRSLLDGGCSIVLTTHYLEEAEALADRVVVIACGRVIAEGTVAEMRALVSRKHISAASVIAVDDVKRWPGVVDARRDAGIVHVTAFDAESVVRRLLAGDERLSNLEVKQATLAEAFTELTKEAA